jgi:hypothetical protein
MLICSVTVFANFMAYGQDLHIKKNISVGGNFVSTTDTSIKGARERSVNQTPGGTTITIRQCDLKRTITLNEQAQTYLIENDPQDDNAARAAALLTGAPAPAATGGRIIITTTVTDTGERKQMYGYQVRHLKAKVEEEPSADACSRVRQSYEIDGWFADISKEQSACTQLAPPVQQGEGCHDTVVSRLRGSGRLGYPIVENLTMPSPDGGSMTVTMQTSELTRQALSADLFDVPAGYRQVNSLAELRGIPQTGPIGPSSSQSVGGNQPSQGFTSPNPMNPASVVSAQMSAQQAALAQVSQLGLTAPGMHTTAMPGSPAGSTSIAAPQALGPKAPGKIRIGVAPPDAQVGQGNNAGADYSTPIRNAEIALMNGPAVEIAPLDSRIAVQLQAEAQQKQCDYILYSSVAVKHSSGGFGKFMKLAPMVAPMAGMGGNMGGAVAAQTAGVMAEAAAMSAQQQAMNQLAGFNGQIKSKDDVTVRYQLFAPGQTSPRLENTLKGKAKSDGEDVLTPLLQQAATNVLTEVTKK